MSVPVVDERRIGAFIFNWREQSPDFWSARVSVDEFHFDVFFELDGPDRWDVAFCRRDDFRFEVTGEGGAHYAFAAVAYVIGAFALEKEAHTITFSAIGDSRKRLYDRWSKRIASGMPGEWKVTSVDGAVKRYCLKRIL